MLLTVGKNLSFFANWDTPPKTNISKMEPKNPVCQDDFPLETQNPPVILGEDRCLEP